MNKLARKMVKCAVGELLSNGPRTLSWDPPGSDRHGRTGRDIVEWVIDGDTVELQALGRSRLLLVDAPEVHPVLHHWGNESRQGLQRLLPAGTEVTYELGLDPHDQWGRSLVYLWLSDGSFVNAVLIEQGHARAFSRPIGRNTKHAVFLQQVERRARAVGRGLWRKKRSWRR